MPKNLTVKLETASEKTIDIELTIHKDNLPWLSVSQSILDLHIIGSAVFEIENFLNPDSKEYNSKIRKANIPYVSTLTKEDLTELQSLLNQLFLFLYHRDIVFNFNKIEYALPAKITSKQLSTFDTILLFSGGLDSAIGLNYCNSESKKPLLVYIRHGTAGQLTPIINKIEQKLIKPKELELIRFAGPKLRSGHFANTRGLLYLLTGAMFSYTNQAPLMISECAVTMYQPRFGPLNHITYTTHPAIITMGKEIYRIIAKKELQVVLPFENNTKAEMIAKYASKENIENAYSCMGFMGFASKRGNCGECYSCLIRRLGILAVMDDPTTYSGNKYLADIKDIKTKLYPVVDFCYRVITDFENLDDWQRERIEKYGKRELFYRFSLDTFLALDKLSKSNKRNQLDWITNFLNGIDRPLIDERELKLTRESHVGRK